MSNADIDFFNCFDYITNRTCCKANGLADDDPARYAKLASSASEGAVLD